MGPVTNDITSHSFIHSVHRVIHVRMTTEHKSLWALNVSSWSSLVQFERVFPHRLSTTVPITSYTNITLAAAARLIGLNMRTMRGQGFWSTLSVQKRRSCLPKQGTPLIPRNTQSICFYRDTIIAVKGKSQTPCWYGCLLPFSQKQIPEWSRCVPPNSVDQVPWYNFNTHVQTSGTAVLCDVEKPTTCTPPPLQINPRIKHKWRTCSTNLWIYHQGNSTKR